MRVVIQINGYFRGKGDEVYHRFTTFAGRKKLIELKLIDGILTNISVGMSFFILYNEYNK